LSKKRRNLSAAPDSLLTEESLFDAEQATHCLLLELHERAEHHLLLERQESDIGDTTMHSGPLKVPLPVSVASRFPGP
jgi:hypothetical protein